MSELKKYRHIIWDWNGTLFDDAWLCLETINWLLAKHGLEELTGERYREVFDFPVKDYYLSAGFDLDSYTFEELGTEFMTEYQRRLQECSIRDDARFVLQEVLRRGGTQSILSAYKETWLHRVVASFGIEQHFQKLIGASDYYAHGKVDNGLQWIKELGLPTEDVVMVGDTIHDHEVASAMGIECILIDGGNQARHRLEKCSVPIVSTLSELLELF